MTRINQCDWCGSNVTSASELYVITDAAGTKEKFDLCKRCYREHISTPLNETHKQLETGLILQIKARKQEAA